MGQIVRRKRRGRPSKIDRARRNSFVAPPSPVDRRRSRRRRNVKYSFDIDDYVDDDEFYDDEDEEVGRREKKLRLLPCEDDSRSQRRVGHAPSYTSSDDYDEDDDSKALKKRKIGGVDEEDYEDNEIEEIRGRKSESEDEEEEAGGTNFVCGTALDLRKELPDYHDVIKHPMDFATIRKKLAKGAYLTLNEFEHDVLLICRNAMQYNAPDTIYYKQASSIQEQAKLRFERLRANGDRSELELKPEQKTTPSFSLPKKQLKKSVAQTLQDPVGSETFPNGSSGQTPSFRQNSGEVLIAENSSLAENNLDKEQELLPDHSYARSLARFAATLGSVAWKVASQTIEQALPEGVKFGRGWVGEYEPLPTPVLMPENRSMKEPDFLSNFKIDGKSSKNAASGNDKARKSPPVDNGLNEGGCGSRKLPVFGNTTVSNGARIHLNQESPRAAGNDLRPPFFSSLQVNPTFSGTNLPHQNDTPSRKFARPSPQVEPKPNHPLPTHASSADFFAKRLISNVSDIPSPRPAKPISQNGNLMSLASFKHPIPNGTNDGFSPKGKPTPVFQDSNRMVPIDSNLPYQQERKPTSVSRDYNRMVPMDNHLPHQQEQKPTSGSRDYNRIVPMDNTLPHQPCLNDPVQMMKMLAEKAQPQQNNSNGFGSGSGSPVGPKREDSNKVQHQQIYSNGSQIGSKRDDLSNVALTAAQAWMSLGGTAGGFSKPPLTENPNPHKIPADSLYNDRLQPQVSRFRGEFPVPGIQNYQQPVHAFVPQPVRTTNEARFQNRHSGFPQLLTTDLSRFQGQSGWRGVAPQLPNPSKPKHQESGPPDLNVGYQSMGSPVRQTSIADMIG
ncbi:Bromodomain-containing protein [Cynara cardunculus var. scolymus]|uniref:Bromodomain-containing protein n=1 Tax=Cynara cardunculus var. scolymus TaxID=59895 RepID=A0A118JYV3_CYNCS|nr:Bromodomain-containing protein [Cynara cardunculus var. scolymus]